MNILFIPSWYPHFPHHPINGIFIQEQAEALTNCYKDINIGVSLWGQKDERLLLWSKDHLKNFSKIKNHSRLPAADKIINENLVEYFTPAFTWTKKILNGNLKGILKANEENLKRFEEKSGKIDLIHAHVGFPAGYIASKLKEKYQIPYLITEQMSPFPFDYYLKENGSLMDRLQKSYENSSANVAISPSLLSKMQQFGIPNLHYIPNTINEDFFSAAEKKVNSDSFIFFSLGRLVEQKGFPDLLRAIKIVSQKNEKVEFRIGGDGEKAAEYKKMAKDLGIEKQVKWLGLLDRTQCRNEFQNCNAFVLPSLHETMGVVFAEATACGKPVISTYNGGAESIIKENENGFLVNPGDYESLANKIVEMMENISQFNPVEIRKDFEKKFSRPVVCRKLKNIYEGIILKN